MGWWKIPDTESVIGDDALEAFEDAIESVLSLYAEEFERRPSPAEWTALLSSVFYAYAPEVATSEGWISDVTLQCSKDPVPDAGPPGLPDADA